jgi:hypothetical protein
MILVGGFVPSFPSFLCKAFIIFRLSLGLLFAAVWRPWALAGFLDPFGRQVFGSQIGCWVKGGG